VDLLPSLHEDPTPAAPQGDLLASMGEGNATAWQPHKYPDHPAGIQGEVISRSTVTTDPKFGKVRDVERVEIRTEDGTVWAITGFHGVLDNQIKKANPQAGDTFAVKYVGRRASRTGNEYHNYLAAKASPRR